MESEVSRVLLCLTMNTQPKTVIVTGASQGIGAGVVRAFLASGYNVVGTARQATKSKELPFSDHLAVIDGDIGQFATAQKIAEVAVKKFGSIDAVVANAGIFLVKPFIEYTPEDFDALVSTNLAGFIYITQLAVKQCRHRRPAAVSSASRQRWQITRSPALPRQLP